MKTTTSTPSLAASRPTIAVNSQRTRIALRWPGQVRTNWSAIFREVPDVQLTTTVGSPNDAGAALARLKTKGAELMGEVTEIEEPHYLMCYVRGPEGIIVGLAEELT